MNEHIIRNLSKTLREIAEATTKPKPNQEKKSLNSFAQVMLDRTALDHTLAEQGRFCCCYYLLYLDKHLVKYRWN